LAAGAGMTVFAVYEILVHELSPVPLVAIAVLPDVALLARLTNADEHRRSLPDVSADEIVHQPLLAVALIVLAIAGLLVARVLNETPDAFEAARRIPLYIFTAGIVWFAHIAFERAFGFRPPAH
jgi:hypothetical protein